MNAHTSIMVVEPDDAQLLAAVTLGVALWHESPIYRKFDMSIDKIIEFAYNCRADDETFFNVVVDARDTCYGFMIGELAEYGFHDSVFAYDRMIYVAQNKRGSVAARALITSFETWARTHGASRVLIGASTGINDDRAIRLYNAMGYTTIGRITAKEIM